MKAIYFGQFLAMCVLGLLQRAVGEAPDFRILAPPFVCPKDEDAVIDKPDNTIVTLQTDAGADVIFKWTVRWSLLKEPTQRFTLALWQTVRTLEKQLNGPQNEFGVYVINNSELLSGVNYVFNVTAIFPEEDESEEKSFNIDNIQGDQKLLIEGRTDMFSITLVGGQMTYADIEYTLEVIVTACFKTHDYFFVWTVTSGEIDVNVSDTQGSRLLLKPNSLTPGLSYNVLCNVFKHSNGEFITGNGLPFRVLRRDLGVTFNVDVLVVSVATPFVLQTNLRKIDYTLDEVTITWECSLNDEVFDDFYNNDDEGHLVFPSGLPEVGEYIVTVTVSLIEQPDTATSSAHLISVDQTLPTIQVHLIPRMATAGSIVNLKANVSDVVPGCSITWYFISDKCILSTNSSSMENCTEHVTQISDTVNFYSLEENFLNELTDYSNETWSKLVVADIQATMGTARIIAECECNSVNNCTNEGTVYADVQLQVNERPETGEVLVTPENGTAMETIFRVSTRALVDPNRPLRYTFYCDLGNNDSLILGTYLEHLALETLLPYVGGYTSLWVTVCDSLGACSTGNPTSVEIHRGDARTLDTLIEDMQAHVMRCEIDLLERLSMSALITYDNADQTDPNSVFKNALLKTLRGIDETCIDPHYDQYASFLNRLARLGVDTSDLV